MTTTLSYPDLDNSTARSEHRSGLSDMVSLLRAHRPELIQRWIVHMREFPGSNYARSTDEELESTCGECLSAYEILLSDGDTEPLWRFIERICALRSAQQFPPSDITEAFMVMLDAAEDVLGPEIDDREEWSRVMRELRQCTRVSLKALVNTYLLQIELAQLGI